MVNWKRWFDHFLTKREIDETDGNLHRIKSIDTFYTYKWHDDKIISRYFHRNHVSLSPRLYQLCRFWCLTQIFSLEHRCQYDQNEKQARRLRAQKVKDLTRSTAQSMHRCIQFACSLAFYCFANMNKHACMLWILQKKTYMNANNNNYTTTYYLSLLLLWIIFSVLMFFIRITVRRLVAPASIAIIIIINSKCWMTILLFILIGTEWMENRSNGFCAGVSKIKYMNIC